MARFFSATAMVGILHVDGIPAGGPWDARRLMFQDEAIVDRVIVPGTVDRKVRSTRDLDDALRESESRPSSFRVWIHEALIEVACVVWERTQKR